MTPLFLAIALAGTLEVDGPAGCLDPTEIANALDAVGGIDVAELVAVRATPVLDEYALVIDIALIRTAPLHREVPLRPRECADVADLVGVLVAGQRRAALEARLRPSKEDSTASDVPSASPKPAAPPAPDPRVSPILGERRLVTGWTPCDGPVDCGGFRLNLGLGPALPFGGRAAIDTGYDVSPSLSVVAVAEAIEVARVGARASVSGGLAWRTHIDVLELSVRGALGGGSGTRRTTQVATEAVCDDGSTPKGPATSARETFFLAPSAAVRGRIGYLFIEAGTFFHIGLDELPGGHLAVGVALFE